MSDKNTNESLFKNWADSQQKLLTDWLDTLRKLGGTPTMELWKTTVDAWQNSVKQTLDAHTAWTHQWIEVLTNAKGTPEELQTLVRQGKEQLQQWTEAERDLWQSWFNVVREINFKPESGDKQQVANDLLQLWQENAYKMIDAQANFVRRWSSGITGTKKQS
jgi:hypothetical protein